MDPRQRSLVAAAITNDFGRVQERLRHGDSYAIVEIAEFLREVGDDEVEREVIRRLVPCLPPVDASAVIRAHPEWTSVVESDRRSER
jgi:hypothetical protein